MICTIIIKCVGGANFEKTFERTIEVPEDMTLGELHDIIQDLTGFDNDHMFTFFLARAPRGKRTSLLEMDDWNEDPGLFYEIPLRNVFPLADKMKLFYWFDFGDDWMFQIGKRGKSKPEDARAKYPKVIAKTGPKPVQYPDCE